MIYISSEKDAIIELILKEFQKVLISLDKITNEEHNNNGYSPKSAIVKYHDKYDPIFCSIGNVISVWAIYLDRIEIVNDLNYNALTEPRDGMYFSEGIFYFSLSSDFSKAILEWTVGPRYGRGYTYSISKSHNKLTLKMGYRLWMS